mmetsp:Transcript_139453/g.242548  ORF Transcript_139453/g.242548 Transcript_139453/m.242548 type:complete len:84 (-) Transcript_139453:122-373(-)
MEPSLAVMSFDEVPWYSIIGYSHGVPFGGHLRALFNSWHLEAPTKLFADTGHNGAGVAGMFCQLSVLETIFQVPSPWSKGTAA